MAHWRGRIAVGGFTPGDVREVVEYARKRHIRVVLRSNYPVTRRQLSGSSSAPAQGTVRGRDRVGRIRQGFCAGNDATFRF